MTIAARVFEIDRSDLRRTRFVDETVAAAEAGDVVLAIEHFALTANNITYAAFGEAMRYWNFFPASEPGWGRLPVWGFATVVASAHDDVAVGERVYGYFPLASHLRIQADRVNANGFVDAADHRRDLAPVYNHYLPTKADPVYEPDHEALHMVLRPLFMTSWLLADFLTEAGDFGGARIILTSASSKTAIGLAHQLSGRAGPRARVVGLTSPGNTAFVAGLGIYDETVAYDALASLEPSAPTVIVDFAGSEPVMAGLYAHLSDLRKTVLVGGSHWDARGGGFGALEPKPEFFFAPDQVKKRSNDWGVAGLMERYAPDWRAFRAFGGERFDVDERVGEAAITEVYADLVDGRASGRTACIARLGAGT